MSLNLHLHLEVQFRHLANTNTDRRFRFEMFGSGSNNVRSIKSIWIAFLYFFLKFTVSHGDSDSP